MGPGRAIRVSSERARDRARLTVEDSGPGVPDELLERVFEPFFRGPPAGRQARAGTGIGLAVVRGLVVAMEGTVSARRSELGGLAVDIELPFAALPKELAGGAAP